jgi:hypothetical protein
VLLDGLVEEMGGNEEACGKFGQNSNDLEDRFQLRQDLVTKRS